MIIYMKIVVVGYGEMFDSLLAGIIKSGNEISGVFRRENILYCPIKRFLLDIFFPSQNKIFVKSLGIYDIKARSVNSEKFRNEIKKLNADLIIVGSWSEKFSMQTINSPNIACINTHPSLLPKFRGPNPYSQTILFGEKQTGITFHLMDVNYDTGAILHQSKVNISNEETGFSLKHKCCELARKEIEVLLNSFETKYQNALSQNETESSYQHHLTLKDSIIDFNNETSIDISKKIRALSPWMKCHIPYKNEFFEFKTYKILKKPSKKHPGTIVKKTEDSLFIVCKDAKVIKFSKVKLKRPILRWFNKFYLKYFVV